MNQPLNMPGSTDDIALDRPLVDYGLSSRDAVELASRLDALRTAPVVEPFSGPAIITSRAWDDSGTMQPLRADFIAVRGEAKKVPNVLGFPNQHYNSLTAWGVESSGEIKHVYA